MPASSANKSLLLYEPRTEGHHLGWLRFITEDLLSAGYQLTLAVDLRPAGLSKVQEHLGPLAREVQFLSAYTPDGQNCGDAGAQSVAFCLEDSGAPNVFLCALDEVSSPVLRHAAFGLMPPRTLQGHWGGICHRPRFLEPARGSLNGWLKTLGFRRLVKQGWFRQIVLLDEYLARERQPAFPGAPFFFLPGPCPAEPPGDRREACRQLGIPEDKRVFLFFGVGSKRKGLHLAVQAMLQFKESGAFLLCAGQLRPEPAVQAGLQQLEKVGRAKILDRYVSTAEEKWCFAACDVVLLPYLDHFGTSAVLFQAAAARRPVIASDEQLLGRLVKDHGLGLLFRSGNVASLVQNLREALAWGPDAAAQWNRALETFSRRYSRTAYREALLAALTPPKTKPQSPAGTASRES